MSGRDEEQIQVSVSRQRPVSAAPLTRNPFGGSDSAVKKPLIALSLAMVVILGGWGMLSYRAKLEYDRVRDELAEVSAYTVAPLGPEDEAFLARIAGDWSCRADEVNGPHSDLVDKAGFERTVANLIHVSSYRLPDYSWTSASRNARAMQIGAVRAELQKVSVDGTIRVSEDKNLALLRCTPSSVYVFRNVPEGLREALYLKKREGTEPSRSTDAADHSDGRDDK